jgi:molybdopterin-guanine dinucleotide biosynthesis protein A
MRVSCLTSLNRFVERGGRKMSDWLESVGRVEVAFDDEADAFRNLNTVEQLTAFEGLHEK